jgi:hypothetical protein
LGTARSWGPFGDPFRGADDSFDDNVASAAALIVVFEEDIELA